MTGGDLSCWRVWCGTWIRESHTDEVGRADALDRTQLKQYMRPLVMTLLTRMQTSRTDKYVYHFTYFLLFMMAIDVAGMGPDYVISTVEGIQPQCVPLVLGWVRSANDIARLWSQILTGFVIPQVPKMPHKDRKVVAVGLTRMLTESRVMVSEPASRSWCVCPSPASAYLDYRFAHAFYTGQWCLRRSLNCLASRNTSPRKMWSRLEGQD